MTTAQQDDDMSVDDHGPLNTVANNDLYPFINKNTPKINVRYTVGGLEKRLADTHWKVLNRINMNRNPNSKLNLSTFLLNLMILSFVLCQCPHPHKRKPNSHLRIFLPHIRDETPPPAAVAPGSGTITKDTLR